MDTVAHERRSILVPPDSSHKKGTVNMGTFHSILYKHYILVFNAVETSTSNPKGILVFNIESKQWIVVTPGRDSLMGDDLAFRVCHFERDKIIRFGTEKSPPFNRQREERPYCEVLVLNEGQSQDGSQLQTDWQEVKINDYQIPALKFATLNFVQNKLYMHGGRDPRNNFISELYIMNLVSKNDQYAITGHARYPAQEKKGQLMRKRSAHSSVVHHDNIYYYGGMDETYRPLYDMWTFNIRSLEWNEIKYRGLMPGPRVSSLFHSKDDTLFLFGGDYTQKTPSFRGFNDSATLVTFDLKTHLWERTNIQSELGGENKIFEIYQNTLIYGTAYNVSLDHSAVKDLQTQPEKDENSFRGSDQKLFREKSFTDVTFKVEGHHITAHRAILATRCQHFNEMFLSSKDDTVIDVPEMKINIFNGLLEYIYCGDVEGLSEEIAAELLKLAEKCGVSGLREFGENFLIDKLAVENVVSITNLADAYGAENLRKACVLFLSDHFAEVFNQQDIKKLSSSALFLLFQKKLVK